jgi:NAD(P)-dependent dehydrogenase (short-subunit alcohol dehydrogenase family)
MTNKVAVITGASRGIGARVAQMLAAEGASIVVNYKKNADMAEQVVAKLRELGGDGVTVQADVENPEDIARIFDVANDKYGRVDYFVNNAAAAAFKRIMDLKPHHLDRSYAMNVRPFVIGAQEAVKLMDKGGRIVALTSYGSQRAYPTYAALGSYKSAIETMIRYMAIEFADYGINVNGVSGGLIESDSLHYFYEKVPGQAPMDSVLKKIPLKRPGTVDEMANTVMFLLGEKSSYITGQTLIVDGGLSVVSPPFWSDTSEPLALPERPTR